MLPFLLCCFLTITVADPDKPQDGDSTHTLTRISGAVERLNILELGPDKLRVRQNGQESEIDTGDLLAVVMRASHPTPHAGSYLEVRLVDDAFFRCAAVGFRGKQVELRLFSGLRVQCSLDALRSLLCEAQDEANRSEFKQLTERNTPFDRLRLVSRDGTTINTFEGIIGDADEDGRTLRFKTDDATANIALNRVRGIIFHRRIEPGQYQPVCKVVDVFQNVIPVKQMKQTGDTLHITAPSGFQVIMPLELVQQVDYSPGKLAWLSDLEPTLKEFRFGVKEDLLRSLPEKYGRDATLFAGQNGSSRQIRIGGRVFAKGLNVHSPTVLEFDVSGYNWFRCVLGMDDGVARPGRAGVRIEGDGRELFSTLVAGADKPKELEIKISGVRRLRLVVDRGDDDDELGDHVSFGDARVTK
ncbi:MAG: NPCBM/NEW2 domain-containing protein [Gemmatales bacterium]|nr:NPCBM/NEW2 domain-containing protein [Gemmatales bacterium]MDW8387135.1 NPCBM/NEW2 domain-containing protein [Gemmatales bacterium]